VSQTNCEARSIQLRDAAPTSTEDQTFFQFLFFQISEPVFSQYFFETTNDNNCTMTTELKKAVIVSDPTKGVKVNASVVAQKFRDEIKAKVQKLKDSGIGKLRTVFE
jgi:hypothetical protein